MALLRAPATSWALVPQAAVSPLARPTPGSTLSPSAPTRGARPGAPRAAWRWGQAGPASPVGRNDLAWGKRVVPGFLQQKMVTELSPAGRPPLPLAPRWAGEMAVPLRSRASFEGVCTDVVILFDLPRCDGKGNFGSNAP